MKFDQFSDLELEWYVSTVEDENMSFRYGGNEVWKNRGKWFAREKIDWRNCVGMDVEHSNRVLMVGSDDKEKGIRDSDSGIVADGLVTNMPGLGLFLLTADCLPLVVYGKKSGWLGLIHVGWKSLEGGVISSLMKVLTNNGVDCGELMAGLGPAIGINSYIKSDVSDMNLKFWGKYIEQVGGDYRIDLLGRVKRELEVLAVDMGHVRDLEIDTAVDKRFYSHYAANRKEEVEGRFATVVMMKND